MAQSILQYFGVDPGAAKQLERRITERKKLHEVDQAAKLAEEEQNDQRLKGYLKQAIAPDPDTGGLDAWQGDEIDSDHNLNKRFAETKVAQSMAEASGNINRDKSNLAGRDSISDLVYSAIGKQLTGDQAASEENILKQITASVKKPGIRAKTERQLSAEEATEKYNQLKAEEDLQQVPQHFENSRLKTALGIQDKQQGLVSGKRNFDISQKIDPLFELGAREAQLRQAISGAQQSELDTAAMVANPDRSRAIYNQPPLRLSAADELKEAIRSGRFRNPQGVTTNQPLSLRALGEW